MLLYPCARAFRWSLHQSALKGDMDVSTLRLQVNHWKEKNQLRELLAANNDALLEARRALLRSNRDNKALSEQVARTRDSNQRLKGALKSAKVMMTSTGSSTVPDAASKTVFIEDAVLATSSPDAAESATTKDTIKSTSAESKAKPRTRTRVSKSGTLQAYVEKFLAYEDEHSTYGKHTKEARRAYLMRFLDIVVIALRCRPSPLIMCVITAT